MTTAIKRRRGTTVQHSTFTGLEGELTVDTTKDTVVVHDGATAGGFPLAKESQATTNVAITGGTITGITDLAVADGGTGASTAANARTNLGVTATGVDTTYAYRANNLSDLASASTARTNLGLGTIATQAASSVAITGGVIDGTVIGGTTRAAGSFTTVTTTNDSSISGLTVGKGLDADTGSTAVGYQSLASTTTALNQTAVGYQALNASTSGNANQAFGYKALLLTTTGVNNAGFGHSALYSNTTGGLNVAMGREALYSNTTASNNTAVGYQAGYSNTTGTYNTFIGWKAGYSFTNAASDGNNTFVGQQAGYAVTTGYQNTFLGFASGIAMTTGNANTIVGRFGGNQGGLDIRTASNYIVLSDGDGNPRGWFDNIGTYCIGSSSLQGREKISVYSTTGEGISARTNDNTYSTILTKSLDGGSGTHYVMSILNSSNTAVGRITHDGTNTTFLTSSDYRLKENIVPMTGALAKIAELKPCNYVWKSTGKVSQGFIAHELQAVIPDAVVGEKDAVNEDGSIKPQGIDTSFLVATLTAAIQELNAKLEAQALEIATLKGL